MRIIIGLLLFLCSGFAIAQDSFFTIKGKVLDSETKEPLPYTSIYLKNKAIGTSSNSDGAFIFHLPSQHQSDTVVVSMIGYENYESPVNKLVDQDNTIYLRTSTVRLRAVTVTSSRQKALSAKQIVKKAVDNIKNNYPMKPFLLEGFFRDLQIENGKYVELLEAATSFYYQDYNPGFEQVHIREVRRSYNQRDPVNGIYDRQNSIIDLMEDNFVKHRFGPLETKRYTYQLENTLPYNGKSVYMIRATSGPFTESKLYIETENFAFVKIELERKMVDGQYYKRARNINDKLGAQEIAYKLTLEYREYQGKMYLKYQREEDADELFEQETKQVLLKQSFMKELFMNDVITEQVEERRPKENMNINRSTESQAKPYNAAFWQYYNLPSQTAQESKIIQELEKAKPFENR